VWSDLTVINHAAREVVQLADSLERDTDGRETVRSLDPFTDPDAIPLIVLGLHKRVVRRFSRLQHDVEISFFH
jgi:hypothetical protein